MSQAEEWVEGWMRDVKSLVSDLKDVDPSKTPDRSSAIAHLLSWEDPKARQSRQPSRHPRLRDLGPDSEDDDQVIWCCFASQGWSWSGLDNAA
jgi:hypothetical protein